jgi:hypothetical protein
VVSLGDGISSLVIFIALWLNIETILIDMYERIYDHQEKMVSRPSRLFSSRMSSEILYSASLSSILSKYFKIFALPSFSIFVKTLLKYFSPFFTKT